jgi:hypothetical protein
VGETTGEKKEKKTMTTFSDLQRHRDLSEEPQDVFALEPDEPELPETEENDNE